MITRKILYVCASVLVACITTTPKKVKDDPSKIVSEMLDNGRFDEAEQYIKTNVLMGRDTLQKMTERTRVCGPIYDRCNQTLKHFLEARACLHDIQSKGCDPYLSPKYARMRTQMPFQLKDWDHKLRIPPQIADMCREGEKWGYLKYSCPYCRAPDYSKLVGAFETKDLCEENRLLAKGQTSNECYSRYIGLKKTVTYWTAKALVYYYVDEPNGLDLNFISQDKCEESLKNGLVYYNRGYFKHEIGPSGSKAKSRFIGKCVKVEMPRCIDGQPIDDLVNDEFI